jgi:hypothetical protein
MVFWSICIIPEGSKAVGWVLARRHVLLAMAVRG